MRELEHHEADALEFGLLQVADFAVGEEDDVSVEGNIDASWTKSGFEMWLINGKGFGSGFLIYMQDGRNRPDGGGGVGFDISRIIWA